MLKGGWLLLQCKAPPPSFRAQCPPHLDIAVTAACAAAVAVEIPDVAAWTAAVTMIVMSIGG